MELNPNSWFIRNYLQCKPYELPNTLCELVWETVIATIRWTLVFGLVIFPIALILILGWGLTIAAMFTDITMAYLFSWDNPWVHVMIIWAAIHIIVLIVVMHELSGKFFEMRRRRAFLKKYYSGIPLEEPKPSLYTQVVRGIWARIKDKTCVIITYKK